MYGGPFLRSLTLASEAQEIGFLLGQKMTCYNNSYPFRVFPQKQLRQLTFAPVTILYGSNGSGKTTLLNILAEKLALPRSSPFNGSAFFGEYVSMCQTDAGPLSADSRILTSDDVTDYLLHLRELNDGIDRQRDSLMETYTSLKYQPLNFSSLDEYDAWKESYDAKRKTKSMFVKDRLRSNVILHSNGETAMKYYVERITQDSLYLIDEPENSLSAALQQELADYISICARYDNCQFVISTHSPFLLALPGAKVYDLDARPVTERHWTQLENVRAYYDFFQAHKDAFP